MLNLIFAPSAAASGTLTLGYSYTNNAGMPKTGSVQLPYVATAQNNMVATVSPTGQITAEISGSDRDDGGTASSFNLTTALNTLPAGWSSTASSLSCSSMSTCTSCQLPLAYSPTATGSCTLTLGYGYDNNAGVAKTETAVARARPTPLAVRHRVRTRNRSRRNPKRSAPRATGHRPETSPHPRSCHEFVPSHRSQPPRNAPLSARRFERNRKGWYVAAAPRCIAVVR